MRHRLALCLSLALFCVSEWMTTHMASGASFSLGPTLPTTDFAARHYQVSNEVLEGPFTKPHAVNGVCPTSSAPVDATPETLERASGEDPGPRIAEPMVFDLIRPLGAKGGEGEVNVLGLVPLRRQSGRANATDPLGLVRRSPDRQGLEWAPEIEYAVCDGIAVEFEVPMENGHLEAYKGAAQVTFGTGFNHRFIHGAQTIVQYDRAPSVWTTTLLYLAGFRFTETWSVFTMLGSRAEIAGQVSNTTVELLSNVSLFADVTDRMVAGIETNLGQEIGGNTEVLVMPQLHYEIDRHWMIQAGVGARFSTGVTLPQAALRIIREF